MKWHSKRVQTNKLSPEEWRREKGLFTKVEEWRVKSWGGRKELVRFNTTWFCILYFSNTTIVLFTVGSRSPESCNRVNKRVRRGGWGFSGGFGFSSETNNRIGWEIFILADSWINNRRYIYKLRENKNKKKLFLSTTINNAIYILYKYIARITIYYVYSKYHM